MLLNTYNLSKKEIQQRLFYLIDKEINRLKYYFIHCAGTKADDIMEEAFFHALDHYDPYKGTLPNYLKSLAKTMSKPNWRDVPVDFLEQTIEDTSGTDSGFTIEKTQSGTMSGKDIYTSKDFSAALVESITANDEAYSTVLDVILTYPKEFAKFCKSIQNQSSRNQQGANAQWGKEKEFKNYVIKKGRNIPGFVSVCLELYNICADDLEIFNNYPESTTDWINADFASNSKSVSKQVVMLNKRGGTRVTQPDNIDSWYLCTDKKNFKVFRIYYADIWDSLCDLLDDDQSNVLKLIINGEYLLRMPSGSIMMPNCDINNAYDNIRAEIVTNIIKYTNARILDIGNEYIYIIAGVANFEPVQRVEFNGLVIELNYEDITDIIDIEPRTGV